MVLPAGDAKISCLCTFGMRVAHKMTAYYRRSCLFYYVLSPEFLNGFRLNLIVVIISQSRLENVIP